jgi:hypothetical protein
MASRGEDRAVVVLQHRHPVGEIAVVVLAGFQRDVEISAEKRRTQFGHDLLDGVAF